MTDLAVAEAERKKTDQALATERIGLELEQKRRQMAVEERSCALVEGRTTSSPSWSGRRPRCSCARPRSS